MNKEKLAVNWYKDEIIKTVTNNKVTVIEAPTGSGKTTQLPQILFDAALDKWGTIGVTQPRRIAAIGVSKRIAYEMNKEIGSLVGYKIRFDDSTSKHTKIKVMTDGILLEELRSDPLLTKYSIIIVDEAHERSLNIDFILGLLKVILQERDDFKVIISSATINAELFSNYFDEAPIISVDSKPFPVEEIYYPMERRADPDEQLDAIDNIVTNIESHGDKGDILIFLPGEGPIKDCCSRLSILNKKSFNNNLQILPLYARLAPEEQNKVFDEYPGKRKIIVATNIAETSITIDGVVYVIDNGFAKINYYNPRTFTSYLEMKSISKASCNQRRGRAGRTAPGIVYRLYSKKDFDKRDEYSREEIYRTDLSEVVLRMADFGIRDFSQFDLISPPNKGAINSAVDTLIAINALDNMHRLTEVGVKMVEYPLMPRFARILLESINEYPDVLNNVLKIISFLSAKRPFLYPQGEEIESRVAQRKLSIKGGDFFTWINVFNKYISAKNKEEFCKKFYLDTRSMNEIINIHSQLTDMLYAKGYDIGMKFDYNKIVLSISSGLKQYICRREHKKKNSYASPTETDIRIHPGSFMVDYKPMWLVGGEIVNTGRTYVRAGAMIPEKLAKERIIEEFNGLRADLGGKPKREIKKMLTTTKEESTKVEVLDKFFNIVKDKRETLADVPHHILVQLQDRKKELLTLDFGNLRCRLMYKDTLILKDKLENLLVYFDKIDLDDGVNSKYPKNQLFLYPNDWVSIFRFLPLVMKPTYRSKKAKNKKAAFLAFRYNNDDTFDFYLEGDFFYAVEVTLNAFEKMFDMDIVAWNDEEKKVVEHIFNKVNELSEEIEV